MFVCIRMYVCIYVSIFVCMYAEYDGDRDRTHRPIKAVEGKEKSTPTSSLLLNFDGGERLVGVGSMEAVNSHFLVPHSPQVTNPYPKP